VLSIPGTYLVAFLISLGMEARSVTTPCWSQLSSADFLFFEPLSQGFTLHSGHIELPFQCPWLPFQSSVPVARGTYLNSLSLQKRG
jgi:hypothetical protein